jgi:hypothetical protein
MSAVVDVWKTEKKKFKVNPLCNMGTLTDRCHNTGSWLYLETLLRITTCPDGTMCQLTLSLSSTCLSMVECWIIV